MAADHRDALEVLRFELYLIEQGAYHAASFGFRVVWVNRQRLPREYPQAAPAHEVGSLAELARLDAA